MKRENLYLVGGALLASTALTTAANAGVFALKGDLTGSVTATALGVSAQVFSATPAAAKTFGPIGLVYRFNSGISMTQSSFNASIGITGAQFNTAGVSLEIRGFTGTVGATGSINLTGAAASVQCGVIPSTSSITLSNCTLTAFTGTGSIVGLIISNVVFDNATGLATAGGSIALTGSVTLIPSNSSFDATASQAVLTSRNSLTATVAAATPSQINVGASPSFSRLANGSLTVTLATINITQTGSLGSDLTSLVTGATAVGAANSIKLTSAALTDDATTKSEAVLATAANSASRTLTSFGAGFVTFTFAAAAVQDTYSLTVNFNGTSQIDNAAAGSVDVTFAALAADSVTSNNVAPPGATAAATAALSRNGLSINVNSIQPSVAQGARTYSSLLRIVNTGSVAGTISIALRNNDTGAALGTYTSASIPAGGSIQVTSAALETGAGITPTASVLYQGTVTGSISGYVQHVNWNQDAGFFSDLSALRQ